MTPRQTYQLLRYMGPRWGAYRLYYLIENQTGALERRAPRSPWARFLLKDLVQEKSLSDPEAYRNFRKESAPSFFFTSRDRNAYSGFLRTWDTDERLPIHAADAIQHGRFRYFDHLQVETGYPPDWHKNYVSGERAPTDEHWTRINEFDYGDVKCIWDLNRFSFAYLLVRAYWRTGDEHYPEIFWQLLENWQSNNLPNQGINWKCGQETTFRAMAWIFALYGFLDAPASTPLRVANLAGMIAASGARIEANLRFALSLKSNHGISESIGLWTIGTLFPEFADAERWREKGLKALEKQVAELIYDDGAFTQHSVVYHRLLLQDLLWALRLDQLNRRELAKTVQMKFNLAVDFLSALVDGRSGQVPYYGNNDGSNILPLSNCDYLDFRPVVQATKYFSHRTRTFGRGPWDEDLLWLFGAESLGATIMNASSGDFSAPQSGYYVVRNSEGFVFTRCGGYKHRPGQADLLNIDLWWRGINIAADPGTYSYNSPPWDLALAGAQFHCGVTVDGLDQMDRTGKFMWLPWVSGKLLHSRSSRTGEIVYHEWSHNGYMRLNSKVEYRRAVIKLGGSYWVVLDTLVGTKPHEIRLHWMLADYPFSWNGSGRIVLDTPAGKYNILAECFTGPVHYSLVRRDEKSPRGWRAPYYHRLTPALSFEAISRGAAATFCTILGPGEASLEHAGPELRVTAPELNGRMQFGGRSSSIITGIELRGGLDEELRVA